MHFKSIADLNRDVISWIPSLPSVIDLIVGIPRSGMMPATLLALYLQKPLTTLDGYLNGEITTGGRRMKKSTTLDLADKELTVLVVDDSVGSGFEMSRASKRIQNTGGQNCVVYGAVYIAPGTESSVDTYGKMVPIPRVFEWNVMHHKVLRQSCVDIDGVLCRDPTPDENDDGPKYDKFISSAKPLFIPTVPVKCLVTNRLEKYRVPTEKWLERQGVTYRELKMMDYPTKAARQRANQYAEHKATAYISTGASLFVESSLIQAKRIVQLAGMPVYCVGTQEMVYPNKVSEYYGAAQAKKHRLSQLAVKAWSAPHKVPMKLARRLWAMLPRPGTTSSAGDSLD